MVDTVDLLQIKIEQSKRKLPLETVNAIDAVDWKAAILTIRGKYGYTFEQLGNLELETELLLSGLVSPKDYPKELETRMGISKVAASELVDAMNDLVFKRIREELIKNIERKKIFKAKEPPKEEPINNTLDTTSTNEETHESREDMLKKIENPDAHPMLTKKLSDSFHAPTVKTEHSLDNISKTITPNTTDTKPKIPSPDPYREVPE